MDYKLYQANKMNGWLGKSWQDFYEMGEHEFHAYALKWWSHQYIEVDINDVEPACCYTAIAYA